MKFNTLAVAVISSVLLTACGESTDTNYAEKDICRAAISLVMGRSLDTVSIDSSSGSQFNLSYTRPEDGSNWSYKCKVEGNSILWGADDGRWRDADEDSKLSFTIQEVLTVVEGFSDGSKKTAVYDHTDFQGSIEKFDTLESKVSYLLGYSNAGQLESQGVNIDVEAFSEGVKASVMGSASAIGEQEAQEVFTEYQAKLQAEAQTQFDQLAEANRAKSEAFLAENAALEDVFTTDSGLQYRVLEAGEGEKPTAESIVQVHYEGRLISGEVFDSSIARGTPVEFALNQVIAGWTEGLQLMPEGSRYELYIPSDLAYGPGGSRSIGPNEALIFVVELIQANYSAE